MAFNPGSGKSCQILRGNVGSVWISFCSFSLACVCKAVWWQIARKYVGCFVQVLCASTVPVLKKSCCFIQHQSQSLSVDPSPYPIGFHRCPLQCSTSRQGRIHTPHHFCCQLQCRECGPATSCANCSPPCASGSHTIWKNMISQKYQHTSHSSMLCTHRHLDRA